MVFNRAQKRKAEKKLKKIVGELNENDKQKLQEAVYYDGLQKEFTKNSAKDVMLGSDAAYIYLYNEFLAPIQEGKLTAGEVKDQMNKLVLAIATGRAKAEERRLLEKERVKDHVESEGEDEV